MSEPIPLFLIPYAGVGGSVFLPLAEHLPPQITPVPLDPPGHDSRSNELPLTRIETIVDDLIQRHRGIFKNRFAIYGHSYGGRIAERLARMLPTHNLPVPVHLFVSGCGYPGSPSAMHGIETLPDDRFAAELRRIGSLLPPREIYPDPYLQQLRLLRADFTVLSNLPAGDFPPLPLPITVFWSHGDIFPETSIREWTKASSQSVRLVELEGDHFFPLRHFDRMAREIRLDLMPQI